MNDDGLDPAALAVVQALRSKVRRLETALVRCESSGRRQGVRAVMADLRSRMDAGRANGEELTRAQMFGVVGAWMARWERYAEEPVDSEAGTEPASRVRARALDTEEHTGAGPKYAFLQKPALSETILICEKRHTAQTYNFPRKSRFNRLRALRDAARRVMNAVSEGSKP